MIKWNVDFVPTARAENPMTTYKTETYFRERQARGELNAFDSWLNASPDVEPMTGDELT